MSDRWLVIGAFAAVYFIWGSTYLFNYWAIESIPPFFMSGTRFLTAGLLLYIWGQFRGEPLPSSKHWWNSFWIGNLFLTIGTGAVVWALQYIDTGIAALIVATDPLLIMMLLWWLFQQRPRWQGLVGAGIGIIGTIILVGQPKFTDSPEARWGLVAIAVALTAWAFASCSKCMLCLCLCAAALIALCLTYRAWFRSALAIASCFSLLSALLSLRIFCRLFFPPPEILAMVALIFSSISF